jgi:hypothetical protein
MFDENILEFVFVILQKVEWLVLSRGRLAASDLETTSAKAILSIRPKNTLIKRSFICIATKSGRRLDIL